MAQRTCVVCGNVFEYRKKNVRIGQCDDCRGKGSCIDCGNPVQRGGPRAAVPKRCAGCKEVWDRQVRMNRYTNQVAVERPWLLDRPCAECGTLIPDRGAGEGPRKKRCDDCHAMVRAEQCRKKDLAKKFRAYGITAEQYDALLNAQGGRCAICMTDRAHPTLENNNFYIDHDHSCCPGKTSCGKCVRGLLCTHCNTGLGYFRDNEAHLASAISYVRKTKGVRAA